jgi:hypothetical protein
MQKTTALHGGSIVLLTISGRLRVIVPLGASAWTWIRTGKTYPNLLRQHHMHRVGDQRHRQTCTSQAH